MKLINHDTIKSKNIFFLNYRLIITLIVEQSYMISVNI